MSLVIEALVLHRRDGVRLLGPISLCLSPGERVGLLGESGSGKSLLVQAAFGIPPAGTLQSAGSVTAFGAPMDRPGSARDRVRGARLAWVPQDPLQAMNPYLDLGDQLALLPAVHRGESRRQALDRLGPLLDRLQLPTRPSFLRRLPHEISGGQRQRLCLAMALACDPELLVLDEATTALDPRTQREVVDLLLSLQRERGLGLLWITHDLALAAATCERLVVLYGGHLLEAGPTNHLLTSPKHPYTVRLLEAACHHPSQETGFLPAPQDRPPGCPYQPRCEHRQSPCATWAPWRGTPAHGYRCESPRPAPD